MRKLKIMTVLLVGIIGFFIFSLTIKASTELKVSIDIEKDRIEFKNEEEPDLNAQCYINSVGGNRKVIVGVYRNNPVEYHLYTNYFQAYD